ncbi:hypothetical protein S40288_01092 [Stachybotrys chartarum IBT 40288]|nr:hypothetical protein S40288_01092 [Stachybotrys chartarum IBT 40288]
MPADRLLNTVLQYFQDVHDDAKTDQIVGTTTHLLTQLSNPLNLGVLTSQLLTAPAIWQRDDGLRTAIRVVGVYSTAATRVHDDQEKNAQRKGPREGGGLRCEDWTRAVVQGADDRSRRWQHLLVLAGVLLGMEGNDRHALSRGLRNKLEMAIVTAANLALEDYAHDGALAGSCIVMGLNFALPLLSDFHKTQLDGDTLLRLTIWTMTGVEGFHGGRFLDDVSRDTSLTPEGTVVWPSQSPSFRYLQELESQPLMANMGPTSKLAAFAVLQAADTRSVLQAQDILLEFSHRVLTAWQQNKLSELDPAVESTILSADTMQTTRPLLWQLLRKLLFATVVTLQAVVSRSLLDPHMLNEAVAYRTAAKSLHILRNLYFISCRDGNSAFQVYEFTYLTSIDVLSRNATACEDYLKSAQPNGYAASQANHLKRTLDLFYLNVAEHLPLALSTEACEALVVVPATAYLSHAGPMSPSMVEVFESAHSAVLSVFSCPQHGPITIQMAPFYIVRLFESFPHQISSRQFRVAFKTVMQVVSPPFPIAATEPHLSETLLEMLRSAIANASTAQLPPTSNAASANNSLDAAEDVLSEQSSLALALVDSLPFLPLPLLEEWLTVATQTVNSISDPMLRRTVQRRFQDLLVSGEMDVERATVAVIWWGTKGGRELFLYGAAPEQTMMSGALVSNDMASKL